MRVLIAGAGIGGLCTALCLQKTGHEVLIFEQSQELSSIGAGLQLGANALKVLEYLGLLSDLEPFSVAPERVDFCGYGNGEVLHSADLGAQYSAKYSAPYLHIHRADLQAVLLHALQSHTQLKLNSKIEHYQENNQSVVVTLADGQTFEGDCLIGADGIKSIVRTGLLGNSLPTFTGQVAWRGIVSSDRLSSDFMDKVVTNFVGQNKHMVIYYLRKQKLINFVGVVEDKTWEDDSWVVKAPWQTLKNNFKGWNSKVQAVIDAVEKEECYRWALYNHKPFNNWSSKRVTLLGDAAHSTLPFLASGAAMAIEDARILQRALDQEDTVSEGFQLYQRNRFERTAKVQKMSTQIAKLYRITNPTLLKFAFNSIKSKSAKTEKFLADYDANIVPLV